MNWRLWRQQIRAIVGIELKRNFLSRRGWWIYLLALMPVFLTFMHSMLSLNRGHWTCTIQKDTMILAGIFQYFYLRVGIFFGCVGIFTHLFRGEMLNRSLHYYLLAPVRREVLLAGKFLSGLITSVAFFGGSLVLSFYFVYLHFGSKAFNDFFYRGPGLEQLGWYLAVTALACLGYGAVFTLMGMLFGNPMIPAAVVMVWEGLNLLLPVALRKISIIYWLKSLCPVDVPSQGVLAVLSVAAEKSPAYVAVPGLLAVSAAVLMYSAVRIRRLEINYSSE